YSDGIRGERKFLPHEALLAAVYDLCRQLKVLHFTISTYTHVASGAFNKSYSIAFISEAVHATAPPAPSASSTAMSLGAGCRPNALRMVAYWMRCSMGNSEDAWPVPVERPVQAHLESDHEVAKEARRKVQMILEYPSVATAVRGSESYGVSEESDFALVRSVQVAHALDLEHRGRFPRTVVVTQATLAEEQMVELELGMGGGVGEVVWRSRELRWNFVGHEIRGEKREGKVGAGRKRRVEDGEETERRTKRARKAPDSERTPSTSTRRPTRQVNAKPKRLLIQAIGNSIDVATMRATAPPEEVVPSPASLSGPPLDGSVAGSRSRPRRRIVSGSTDATAVTG
ncbi:hypothetical protein FRB90_010708, partial [Tulasnella sp. 427]